MAPSTGVLGTYILHEDKKSNLIKVSDVRICSVLEHPGIQGWFGLSLPQDVSPSQASHCSVGGLDLSLTFAHHSDRDRVVKAARSIGWEPEHRDEDDCEDAAADDGSGVGARSASVSVAVPRAWLPVQSLVLPGDTEFLRSTYCYFRYGLTGIDMKLYHCGEVQYSLPKVCYATMQKNQPYSEYCQLF